jgi:hypothetical protein
MPRFLLLLPRAHGASAAEQARVVEWIARGHRAGVLETGARLEAGAGVTRRDGITTVVSSADSAPGAYFVIEAEDLPSATAIAAGCPLGEGGTTSVLALDTRLALGNGG